FGDLRGAQDATRYTQAHALTMSVDLQSGAEAYWDSRSPKLLSNIRRYERKALAYCPDLVMRCTESPADMQAAVERYGRLEAKGWKGEEGSALEPDSAQYAFYLEVMLQAASLGQARVYELWADDELLASRLLLVQPSMVVCLKTTFDESHQDFAPGRIMLKRMLDALLADPPAPRVEFYTDANADQLSWASEQRWIYHVESFRNLATARFRRVLRRVRPRLPRRKSHLPVQPRIGIDSYKPDALPDDVKRLMAKVGESRHIELGANWFELLARTVFARHNGLRVYVLRHAGKPVAVLPTLREGHELCALANYYSAYFEPVLAESVGAHELQPLMEAIRRQTLSASQYRFWPMDPAHPSFVALSQAMHLAGLKPLPFFCFGNWYLNVNQAWDTYLAARSGQIRSTLKRTAKRFAERGGRLTQTQGGPTLEEHLLAYEKVYAASWKTAEPYPNFVRGLVQLCAERGWLRLGVAWVDNEPVAAQIWYVNGGRASIFKLAYDEKHKALAAGNLITAMLMEQVLDVDAVQEVDYLIGDDAYKQAWMSHRRER
ncbi:MAG: GNAT family N-acetyltransferase, partial [Inhella sp.]